MADAKQQAVNEKELGNAAYKKKEFEKAIEHYDKAIELDPTNITFLTNKAAVFFEQNNFEECIKICHQAVEIGREHRADYKLIAKAFARIGNAYLKQEDLQNALTFYNKSLSENRTKETADKVKEVEKKIKEMEMKAYINPELSLEEKKKGNEYFQKGDFPSAVKHYTEAIKRNPEDAKIYSNRAACYTKLMEISLALKDCNECIRLDPSFIKGYLRKGSILMLMKSMSQAAEAYKKALELDPNHQEARDGLARCMVQQQNQDPEAVRKDAMANPEVQAILSDPAMRLILEQMQENPEAAKEHLQNPEIRQKIQKLMECGILQIR